MFKNMFEKVITNEWEGFEYPKQGGAGENTPFTETE